MQRELFFSTIDFLIQAIEARDAEIDRAAKGVRRRRLETQRTHLQRRLHLEFCYLSAFADDGEQAH